MVIFSGRLNSSTQAPRCYNPTKKKLDGIRDERGRGHGINVMSDSALGPRRPPRSKVGKTPGAWARRSPPPTLDGGAGGPRRSQDGFVTSR